MELNKIIHADCMEVMKDIPDKYFELAIVDPPYGIGDFWNKSKHTYKYGKKNWNEKPPDENYFNELFRISKNQIIWGANYYTRFLPERNSWLIWDKERDADKTFMSECELAWTSFKDVMRIIKLKWNGAHKCEKVYNQFHPNQRPVKLYQMQLKRYANTGDKIIDTHSGSGSCAIACHLEGFDFLAIEKDEDYYDASVKRFEEIKAQGVLF